MKQIFKHLFISLVGLAMFVSLLVSCFVVYDYITHDSSLLYLLFSVPILLASLIIAYFQRLAFYAFVEWSFPGIFSK
jgi:hypothetical protein